MAAIPYSDSNPEGEPIGKQIFYGKDSEAHDEEEWQKYQKEFHASPWAEDRQAARERYEDRMSNWLYDRDTKEREEKQALLSDPEALGKKHRAEDLDIAEERSMENPLVRKEYEALERRSTGGILDREQMSRWEKQARVGADHQRNAIRARARSLGVNASQMGALDQRLQEADAQFERQVYQMREEDRFTAKGQKSDFRLAMQEGGLAAIQSEQRLQLQKDEAAAQRSGMMWGSIFSFLGTAAGIIATVSDERVKSNVDRTKTGPAAYDFLENLDVAQYNMPGANSPEMGVMAQSMERSPLGQQAVIEDQGVKAIDIPQAFKSLIVAQKEMHDRVKTLENGRGEKQWPAQIG